MDDRDILTLYRARAEEAIRETETKYGRYCYAIAYRILSDRSDAEEVVNDTYLKLWNTIPPAVPASLKAYAGMIARQRALDVYDARHAEKRGGEVALALEELAECLPGGDAREAERSMELRDALNRFLHSLPERTRRVFVRRYWYASPVAEIAREYGLKESHVTVMMLRTRKKLKIFLQKEGIDL